MKKFFKFAQTAQEVFLFISTFAIVAGCFVYIFTEVWIFILLKSALAVFGLGLLFKVISIYGLKLREAKKIEPKVIALALWCGMCLVSMVWFFAIALDSFLSLANFETIYGILSFFCVIIILGYTGLALYYTGIGVFYGGRWIIKYLRQ